MKHDICIRVMRVSQKIQIYLFTLSKSFLVSCVVLPAKFTKYVEKKLFMIILGQGEISRKCQFGNNLQKLHFLFCWAKLYEIFNLIDQRLKLNRPRPEQHSIMSRESKDIQVEKVDYIKKSDIQSRDLIMNKKK